MSTIYYCISGPPRLGGQHVNVEHVVALRNMGLRACLLYMLPGTEAERFESEAPVVLWSRETPLTDGDVIVVPESWPKVVRMFSGFACRKVLHCQNPYYVFHSFEDADTIGAWGYRDILSCSAFTTGMLRSFGYRHLLHTVRPALAPQFRFPAGGKALQIAYMPRKRENESVFVKGLFRSLYPQYKEIAWVAIKDVSREECARVLQESQIFAALSCHEGLGLPPLEAMASGCVVAGFMGQGGAEYADPANGFWVQEGDYAGFARQLAQAIEASRTPWWRQELLRNYAQTLQHYSRASFTASLAEAWQTILGTRRDDFLLLSE